MREPPAKLDDEIIAAALRSHYTISPTRLKFLSLGNDAASAVYRDEAASGEIVLTR